MKNSSDLEAAIAVQSRWMPEIAAARLKMPKNEIAARMTVEAAKRPPVLPPRDFEAEARLDAKLRREYWQSRKCAQPEVETAAAP